MSVRKNSAADEMLSLIKFEGDKGAIVWKHPTEDFSMGSQLIVQESQEALFFRNGKALDLFPAGRYTLETQNTPIINKFYKPPTGNETFHSEIFFINLVTQIGIRWGTDSKVRYVDPVSGIPLDIGACGEFNIKVSDSRKLIVKLVGTASELDRDALISTESSTITGYFKAMIMTKVKSYLAKTIKQLEINILEVDEHLEKISNGLRDCINPGIEEYGLTIPEFFVTRILTPEDDPNFRRLRQQFADQYLKIKEEQIRQAEATAAASRMMVEAETEARLKVIDAQGDAEALKLQKAAEAEAYRMQAEAEATAMKMKGYTYAQETARQVGVGAVENGFGGNTEGGGNTTAGSGMFGDLLNLGIGLGAMGGVVGMTKEAMSPLTEGISDLQQSVSQGINPKPSENESKIWSCSCGNQNIIQKFCGECGTKNPNLD